MIIPCILVLSVLFDFVWSTRYSPVFLSVSTLPCLALPCLDLIKDYYLSLLLVSVFLFPPRVCTVTIWKDREGQNRKKGGEEKRKKKNLQRQGRKITINYN